MEEAEVFPTMEESEVDLAKRARAIAKKLRQINELHECVPSHALTLLPDMRVSERVGVVANNCKAACCVVSIVRSCARIRPFGIP